MKVAFGITVNAGTPLLRREDTQKFMDLDRQLRTMRLLGEQVMARFV